MIPPSYFEMGAACCFGTLPPGYVVAPTGLVVPFHEPDGMGPLRRLLHIAALKGSSAAYKLTKDESWT